MNLTTVTAEGTLEHYDVSELGIEFGCNAEIKVVDPLNSRISCDSWNQNIVAGASLQIIERENKLSTKEHTKQNPYVLLRLDTLEKINFSEQEIAYKTLRQQVISGEKVLLFEFNQTRKTYEIVFISII